MSEHLTYEERIANLVKAADALRSIVPDGTRCLELDAFDRARDQLNDHAKLSERIWFCKIGGPVESLPPGSDLPMRRAVQIAFEEVTGHAHAFTFSGWGGSLTEGERAVVENRTPAPPPASAQGEVWRERAAHDCLLRECSIVDAYDTVRDLCLASRSPSHDLVEAADAMYARLEEKNDDSRYSTRELLDSYDRARARYAEGAQASGAPAKWRVEVVHGRARLIVDASGDSGEQSFWINDADTDDEPGHAEFHARMLRIAIGRIVGAPAPASAQGEIAKSALNERTHSVSDAKEGT